MSQIFRNIMYNIISIFGQMIQKLRLPGLSVALRLSANTTCSCAFLMTHVNNASTCTDIAIPGKLSINISAFFTLKSQRQLCRKESVPMFRLSPSFCNASGLRCYNPKCQQSCQAASSGYTSESGYE